MWTRDKYNPQPIDTTNVEIPADLRPVRTLLAKSVHDTWAITKIEQGETDPSKLDHEDLIDFEELTAPKQAYDYNTVDAVLKGILALGYTVVPAAESVQAQAAD